jgi:hypothetical protein
VEFIFDNLPIVLFIVITIVVRVLQARAKAAARQNEPPPQVFASALTPDDDEPERRLEPDDDDEGVTYRPGPDETAIIDYSRTRGASAYAVEKARTLLERLAEEGPPRFEGLSGVSADKPLAPPPEAVSGFSGERNSPPVRERQRLPAGFPYKLGNLSPLQGAVVWAEILGKPKGIV